MYLQKFDVNDDRSNNLFWHQYMTNCLAPYNEAKSMYNGYCSSNLLNSSIGFVIPVYENMPEFPTSSPAISENDFQNDNTRVFANVTTTLNIRSGPGTSYERLTSIQANQTFTRIGKGVQNGERWDKVLLDNGMVGYVFQTYVEEYVEEVPEEPTTIPVEKIVLDNTNINLIIGSKMTISPTVLPENASKKNLVWSSDDETIATVNTNGEITAVSVGDTVITVKSAENANIIEKCNVRVIDVGDDIYFELDESIKLNGDEISGVDRLTVDEFKELINTNLVVEFYDNSGNLLLGDSLIGTGYRLCLKDLNGVEIYNYYFIIYGDVNGDADINALDVLVLQKYILEIRQLDGLFLKAGNISKNGEVPSSLDVLKVQKHILEIKFIEQ